MVSLQHVKVIAGRVPYRLVRGKEKHHFHAELLKARPVLGYIVSYLVKVLLQEVHGESGRDRVEC
jgi:hypothetical protein